MILGIPPSHAAEQLTLLGHSLMTAISLEEFEDQNWTKIDKRTKSPNIIKMITLTNKTTHWIITTIVQTNDIKERAKVIEWFIEFGNECLTLKNYNAVCDILSGLSHTAVYRLKKTWELVDAKKKEDMEVFKMLFDIALKDWSYYKTVIEREQCPTIPSMLFIISCLVATDSTKEDKQDYYKTILNPLITAQKCVYLINRDDTFLHFWTNLKPAPPDNEIYKMSYQIEPRENKTPIQNQSSDNTRSYTYVPLLLTVLVVIVGYYVYGKK